LNPLAARQPRRLAVTLASNDIENGLWLATHRGLLLTSERIKGARQGQFQNPVPPRSRLTAHASREARDLSAPESGEASTQCRTKRGYRDATGALAAQRRSRPERRALASSAANPRGSGAQRCDRLDRPERAGTV
jgi:hypothetical protein